MKTNRKISVESDVDQPFNEGSFDFDHLLQAGIAVSEDAFEIADPVAVAFGEQEPPTAIDQPLSEDSIAHFLKEIGRYKLLSGSEEIELARAARNGDLQAKRRLIQTNLRLVVSIAKRFTLLSSVGPFGIDHDGITPPISSLKS